MFMVRIFKPLQQFKSSDSGLQDVLNDLNGWNVLNGPTYALTAGRTSCPNKSICWYQSA